MQKLQIATSNWHPRLSSFLIGERNNQFFFRPDKLNVAMKKSLQLLYKLQTQNKRILFVTTRPQLEPIVKKTAERLNQDYLAGKWIGGQFTNSCVQANLLAAAASNSKYNGRPDCVVLLDPTNDILREAAAIRVPVISLFDSNANLAERMIVNTGRQKPTFDTFPKEKWIHYIIPSPNTSFSFIYNFLNLITKTLMLSSKAR